MSWLNVESRAGEPIVVGRNRLIPFFQTIRVLPGPIRGFSWTRPVSILAQKADGEEQIVPIVDKTHQVQLLIFGFGLLGSLLLWIAYRSKGA